MCPLRSQNHCPRLKRTAKVLPLRPFFSLLVFLFFWVLTYIAYPISDDIGSVFIVLAFFSPLLSIPGFIFGIKGLRSSRKGLAIAGIVFNVLLFLVLIFFGVFMFLISLIGADRDYCLCW